MKPAGIFTPSHWFYPLSGGQLAVYYKLHPNRAADRTTSGTSFPHPFSNLRMQTFIDFLHVHLEVCKGRCNFISFLEPDRAQVKSPVTPPSTGATIFCLVIAGIAGSQTDYYGMKRNASVPTTGQTGSAFDKRHLPSNLRAPTKQSGLETNQAPVFRA